MFASQRIRATVVSLVLLLVLLGIWEGLNIAPTDTAPMSEYELLMGGASQEARVPPPSAVITLAFNELSNPFYDAGPNDKGIGIQLGFLS